MLPTISDFFGTTFTDSLSKFLQPIFILLAALFSWLNLIFIIPPLAAANVPFAQQISSADTATKAIVGIPLILILSYIFLSFNTITLEIMNGEAWRDTWLGEICIYFQGRKRGRLDNGNSDNKAHDVLQLEYITRFSRAPDAETGTQGNSHGPDIEPTALGNVLNATTSYIRQHYGIEFVALWPHMQTVIAADATLSGRVADEKNTLDFLVNFSFILLIFAIEWLCTFVYVRQFGSSILWVLLPLALSYVIYQAAVLQARTWGDVVEEAFDLHRDDLKGKLGLRDFTSQEDERQVWKEVCDWLIWGDNKAQADDCFAGQPTPPTPIVTCSANIKVDVQTLVVATSATQSGGRIQQQNRSQLQAKQAILYTLIVSNVDTSEKQGTLQAAYVLISDAQVPTICPKPDNVHKLPDDVKTVCDIIGSRNDPENPEGLLWTITGLSYNGAAVIRYRLPMP
jgi:hypothetical protein